MYDGFIGCASKEAQSGSIVTLDPYPVKTTFALMMTFLSSVTSFSLKQNYVMH